MREGWTRRRFLAVTAARTAAAGAARRGLARGAAPPAPFTARARATLRAAMDGVVPAADGMPAASEAGVAAYLEAVASRDAAVRRSLVRAASALDARAGGRGFAPLESPERIRVLAALEEEAAPDFESLRDLVYEGYYTRPAVWERLGFTFYGPDRPGPGVGVFDEATVAGVLSRGPLWRKVP